MTRKRKPLPPFSKSLNVEPDGTVYVLTGDNAFERARDRTTCIVLPDGDDPYDYTWPVNGTGVIVLDRKPLSESEAIALAVELREAGATCIIWNNQVQQTTSWLMQGDTL